MLTLQTGRDYIDAAMNSLEQLRQHTIVVADTSDFNLLARYRPQDATTNPSLLLKAAQKSEYSTLVATALRASPGESLDRRIDRLLVAFGSEILKIIPGRVSTEIDARLSFDTEATIAKAHDIIALYQAQGIDRSRVLIKIASTWEGIRAAHVLEREGIHCNMTLLFSHVQALACADAGATLISPFVGRITDWFKKRDGRDYLPDQDPGVMSVRRIYATFKRSKIATEIMGASFRSTAQILALTGCDLLTISPELLEALRSSDEPATRQLDTNVDSIAHSDAVDERAFRWQVNEDAMATEKLAEGIRAFAADSRELDQLVDQLAATR